MSRSQHARPTYAAGASWRKWESPMLDPRFPVRPWWEFKAGMVGFWLICASVAALAALVVR